MAAIDDLIAQIEDKALRKRLREETKRIIKKKKFGLVFEDHLPELTPIYSAKVRRHSKVALRNGPLFDIWRVLSAQKGKAHCRNIGNGKTRDIPIDELVVVCQFGEPIFPALVPMDKVQNGSDDAPWHTLIEADNYHALQLLEYLYAGKVDCIYIDPPYNSGGQRDWKYNNDYVDETDNYRHSKWLAMMCRRLRLAKTLLKPDGVLIIAIDENEHAHLICLLESECPDCEITSVSIVHNPRGNRENNFTVTNEYAVHVIKKGVSTLAKTPTDKAIPRKLRRWGHFSKREERRLSFYPIYIKDNEIIKIGTMPDDNFHPSGRNVTHTDGMIEIWPIDDDGVERRWNYGQDTIKEHLDRIVVMSRKDGDFDLFITEELSQPKTVWVSPELDSGGKHGSSLVQEITRRKFPYPKSLYAVIKVLNNVVKNKPNALLLDFFSGSGTTLHATNLLNMRDFGNRRCIIVTNNEVSAEEANEFKNRGLSHGDAKWEQHGICQSITWPRSKYTIFGKRDDGSELEGEYSIGKTIEKEKSRKFKHIAFTSIDELNTATKKKQLVSLIDGIPQSEVKKDSTFVVSEKHSASILFDDSQTDAWLEALEEQEHITDFYIVTSRKATFDDLRARIDDLLGPILVTEEEKLLMREGFPANLEYFRLDFLDKDRVALGRQFREILPLLWLRAGAIGQRPELPKNKAIPAMVIPKKNPFAVLVEEARFADFADKVKARHDLTHVFLVTDSEEAFQEMAGQLKVPNVIQLYRDYLENFVINKGEDAS